MKLLTDLVWKCYKNDLSIDITPTNYGSVSVWDMEKEGEIRISDGCLKNWKWETPEKTLIRMHKEVDAYLDPVEHEEIEPEETETARAVLTENERKMKEAGHKESDFA